MPDNDEIQLQEVKDQNDTPAPEQSEVSQLEANARALDELLDAIEKAASVGGALHGGVYQRNKGTRFETLTRIYFQNEPTYKDLFSKVETYTEWAKDRPGFSAGDTGIDLVGTLKDGTGFAAIQCKFYGKKKKVAKSGVDSFIAAANKDIFRQRYIVATNETWTDNLKQELDHQKDQIIIITRGDMARSAIDWSAYLKSGETEVKLQKPRELYRYQKLAVDKVVQGLAVADRGKLIMACGTGKTFTSMKIAERIAPKGFVMFLVPSLSLLSQTLSDWKQNTQLHAYAVCSDSSTGIKDPTDEDNLLTVSELNYPATTNAKALAENVAADLKKSDCMTVIFSTYQSIDVVSQAQKLYGLPDLDLVICDEAHRTAGAYLIDSRSDEEKEAAPSKAAQETDFTRIHNADYIKAKKRLYMTATPKIWGEAAKSKGRLGEAVLYSMDDETVFGKTLYEISFRKAVSLGCLCDYKVIVLTMPESLGRKFTTPEAIEKGEISSSNAVKIVGAWRALGKNGLSKETSLGDDIQSMKRAVGFAQYINPKEGDVDRVSSKQFAQHFQDVIRDFMNYRKSYLISNQGNFDDSIFSEDCKLVCDTKHIDGSMDATEKDALLSWLREEPEEDHCKILMNVRCLSEGVDVPSLDAVIFFTPRKSQVDVVQTVGRVMRKAPNKRRGYVIIPIVLPYDELDPSLTMEKNEAFRPVWQVLKALRSIDPELGVDGQLGKIDNDHIEVVCLTEDIKKKSKKRPDGGNSGTVKKGKKGKVAETQEIMFGHDEIMMENIKALIVKKVGNVREWEDWAEDVGQLCRTQIDHLKKVVSDPGNEKQRAAFTSFTKELRATLNESMTDDEALEMLGQHIVTKPVMDALFQNEHYNFMEQNPISKALTSMVQAIDRKEIDNANLMLKDFYDSVKRRAKNITKLAERQIVVRELFDKFFKFAFPKMRDKLGIVYTPEPVVDFIIQSVADILKKEFGASIADPDIHVLDPFTGTGTFMLRLLQSGLIPLDRLKYKFEHELHANELVPLAYYVASMNLEMAYHDIMGDTDPEYKPNNVMVWTDTFADNEANPLFKTELKENNARLAAQLAQDIRVVISNPPYSVGQDSGNDDNQNEHYEKLDQRLTETYVARTSATLRNSLYDSYIRAYRWASDRIGNKGVIGFVTNAGWLDSNSADGMRKCMAEEFNSIYIYHLKGNQRTSGERSRQEGGKVFGEGSRAPVAIVILVKNPDDPMHGKIYFHAVADYLSREDKLKEIAAAKSISNVAFDEIIPDSHGDWLNQRDDSFSKFMRLDGKKSDESAIFENYSNGVKTNRDAWTYNSVRRVIEENMRKSISHYNEQVKEATDNPSFEMNLNPKLMKWDRPQRNSVVMGKYSDPPSTAKIVSSVYRPFIEQYLYFDSLWNNCVYQMPVIFPSHSSQNLTICVNQNATQDVGQIALMTNCIADLHLNGDSQCFPLYLYSKRADFDTTGDDYERHDAITNEALAHFQSVYAEKITKEDLFYYIYGILHSEDYRTRYANNLGKELPRIPRVATYEQFKAFSDAGRKLADLHVNFEKQQPYPAKVIIRDDDAGDDLYKISKIKYAKIPGKKGNAAWDKTTIIYNDHILIEDVPLEAQEYVVNKRSALDWILEKAEYKVDKDSGIVNDFNQYGLEMNPPNARYPLDLLLKVMTVSVETVKIVKALPKLEIHPEDQ